MQVAIVSDIHGNRHAFEAVLADVRDSPAEAIWCLGDVVGYGADPNDCCRLAREHADVCLAGNHDLAVTGDLDLGEFSTGAALAARWTQEVIDAGHRDWLASLKPAGSVRGVGLYHASPRDPVWEYVLSALLAELCLDAQPERLALVGHSHVALSFVRPEGEPATGSARRGGEEVDVADGEWILNPGSVGQPRDGDARAAWLLLDTERLDRALAAHRVRHRRRRGRDPRRAPARLAGRAPGVRSMRMRVLPALAALVLGAATAVLVACGGDGRIPAGDASSLKSALNQISADYRAGHCAAAAQRAVAKAQNELLDLPDSVDAKLRDRLQSGISNLAQAGPRDVRPDADPDAGDPARHEHDGHDDHRDDRHRDHRHRDDRNRTPTDTDTTGTDTDRHRHRDPARPGRRPGTDTGTGGTSVGGATTP